MASWYLYKVSAKRCHAQSTGNLSGWILDSQG